MIVVQKYNTILRSESQYAKPTIYIRGCLSYIKLILSFPIYNKNMETCLGIYLYHDGLNHYDRLEWFDVDGYSGFAVVECNCKLTNAALLPDSKDEKKQMEIPKGEMK
jgi:hypothetical protein